MKDRKRLSVSWMIWNFHKSRRRDNDFLRFLQDNTVKINKKSKGGIYQVSIYEESFEPPILGGIAIQKGESVVYSFDTSDEDLFPFLEELLDEDQVYDIQQYTPKVFQKLHKEFGELEDYD